MRRARPDPANWSVTRRGERPPESPQSSCTHRSSRVAPTELAVDRRGLEATASGASPDASSMPRDGLTPGRDRRQGLALPRPPSSSMTTRRRRASARCVHLAQRPAIGLTFLRPPPSGLNSPRPIVHHHDHNVGPSLFPKRAHHRADRGACAGYPAIRGRLFLSPRWVAAATRLASTAEPTPTPGSVTRPAQAPWVGAIRHRPPANKHADAPDTQDLRRLSAEHAGEGRELLEPPRRATPPSAWPSPTREWADASQIGMLRETVMRRSSGAPTPDDRADAASSSRFRGIRLATILAR